MLRCPNWWLSIAEAPGAAAEDKKNTIDIPAFSEINSAQALESLKENTNEIRNERHTKPIKPNRTFGTLRSVVPDF